MTHSQGKSKRRGAGEGSVFKDEASGRWVGFVDLGRDASGKRRRRKVQRRTKKEVVDALDDIRQAERDGKPQGDARDTLGKLASDFLARGLPPTARAEYTRQGYKWAIEQHITPALGARRLMELSADDVDGWLRGLAERGYARSTIAGLHHKLTALLRWGERRGRVQRNVSTLVDTPSGTRRESRALTIEQGKALLAAAANDRLEGMIMLGLTVPSRPGELAGLCWNDLDLDNGVVHFRRALHRETDGSLTLGELKTPQSRRSVSLPAITVDALKRRRAAQRRERMAAGPQWEEWSEAAEHDGLVFTSVETGGAKRAGQPLDPSNVRRALRRLCRAAERHHTDERADCECLTARAGRPGPKRHRCGGAHVCDGRCLRLPTDFTVYELRHSAVSALSHAGVPIEAIADASGHRNSTVTARVYRHGLAPVVRAAGDVMDGVYGAASE
ncbi:Phage integrase family protein [Haloechinothrix alba]|uniref:Phage integrase family protein n=1 Tax=Haloechinothrix alba TaxID=664784 RepID=A0A238WNL2_9PSEU|nr:site-specific integrase [Haloechinothrix alba]SNR47844.1 Phage integrase family protein [Haloechinothrix alba]